MRPVLLPNVGLGVGSLYIDLDNPGGATLRLISTNPPTFAEIGAGGSGDVAGPVSSTNGAMARWSGTGGDTLQDGSVPGVTGLALFEAATAAAALAVLGLALSPNTDTRQLVAFAPTSDCSTGDGKVGMRIWSALNGWVLTAVAACVTTAGITGTLDVQLRRVRSGSAVDMLSTKITVDSTEVDTSTAATPAVINTANDDVATGDQIYVDVDAVQSGTLAKGLIVVLTFTAP